jgi:heme-degrading monooxygenase HmoA
MFAVFYRWTIKREQLAAFIEAWTAATLSFRAIGALGSRLHRSDEDDGPAEVSLYAYAEWPSRKAWEDARELTPVDPAVATVMREATISFEMTPLTPIADLLIRSVGD